MLTYILHTTKDRAAIRELPAAELTVTNFRLYKKLLTSYAKQYYKQSQQSEPAAL